VDALIGRLLDRLDELGLADDTVICLWGDHGFHLGEQGLWTKANNFELSARVPLVLSVPGQRTVGSSSDAIVELVDLYPTLADVCGLSVPNELEGLSMKPLLEIPNRPWKTAAFNQYPRMFEGLRHKRHGDVMGYAIRTDRFRYVQWKNWKSGKIESRELYDHKGDSNEMNNVASNPEYATALSHHQKLLNAGWKGALPK
jgi:iduronate 2-sulfatase